MTCWICNTRKADSREHIIKKSDITRAFGKGSYSGGNAPVHVKNGKISNLQGADSNKIKYETSLCKACNGASTQPFDKAYDKFISYMYANETSILKKRFIDFFDVYGEEFEKGQRDLYKYYAKSFGCRLVDAGEVVPSDIPSLFFKDSFSTGLRINFAVNEDILIMPNKDRDGFIGKGESTVWLDKYDNKKINGYTWSEHVSWLTAFFWYNIFPDGCLGSIWVADSQFIYLGSFEPLDNEQRKNLELKLQQ
ncbi:MAG: hypothetical protein PHQ03_06900 [Methylococcales bacterium]|nr:hypothetical protein [Methylococcales bacterium]